MKLASFLYNLTTGEWRVPRSRPSPHCRVGGPEGKDQALVTIKELPALG